MPPVFVTKPSFMQNSSILRQY